MEIAATASAPRFEVRGNRPVVRGIGASEVSGPGETEPVPDGPEGTAVPADPEAELLRRHLEGDPDAFADLVAAYRGPVWSYLHRSGVAAADREDLFQEIFVRVHRAADRFDPARGTLHPWLFTIVANTVRTHLRQGRFRNRFLSREEPPAERLARPALGDRRAAARQALSHVERELRELPPVQRQVVLLASVERLRMREIALALDLPEGTVKTHLRRARIRLAARLAVPEEAP